jgi:Zn finger protein HypA/HybF involved in hydrogenase expression
MSNKYNSGGAYKAMLKLFREAKLDMDKDKEKTSCLRCNDTREIWVWKDTSESEKIKVDCPMCSAQRSPEELRELGII